MTLRDGLARLSARSVWRGEAGAECQAFRIDYKWIMAFSALLIVGGFYLRGHSRTRFK
jgi:hypothetical protein